MMYLILVVACLFNLINESGAETCYNNHYNEAYNCNYGCCGNRFSYNYGCCSMTGLITGAVVGSIVLISVIVCCGCVLMKKKGLRGRVVNPSQSRTVVVHHPPQPPPYNLHDQYTSYPGVQPTPYYAQQSHQPSAHPLQPNAMSDNPTFPQHQPPPYPKY